jgi:HEAT repeat protein
MTANANTTLSKESIMRNLVGLGIVLAATTAWAGKGGSTTLIESAIASGSPDTIVAELERSEFLPTTSAIPVVLKLIDFDSYKVREAAGWWLTRRGARSEMMDMATSRLAGQDPVAARNAADVLSGMRDVSTLPALAKYLAAPLDEASGMAAANAIGQLGHPAGLKALQAALSSPLAGVRNQALVSIRDLRAVAGQSAVTTSSTFSAQFTDADTGVRTQAAYTAGHLHDRAAVTPLSQLVAGDTSPQVRKAAAWALGEIGDSSAGAALTAALNDSDALVRSVAKGALGRLH